MNWPQAHKLKPGDRLRFTRDHGGFHAGAEVVFTEVARHVEYDEDKGHEIEGPMVVIVEAIDGHNYDFWEFEEFGEWCLCGVPTYIERVAPEGGE